MLASDIAYSKTKIEFLPVGVEPPLVARSIMLQG